MVSAFNPVARLGYSEYTTVDSVWKLRRPDDNSQEGGPRRG